MKHFLLLFSIFLGFLANAQTDTSVTMNTLKNKLLAYYPFNGNADDVSGGLKHGWVNKAVLSADKLGKPDSAYIFSGVNSMISLPNNLMPGNTAFAISCWIKVDGSNFASTMDYGQTMIDLRGQFQVCMSYYEYNHPVHPANSFGFYIYSNSDAKFLFTPSNFVQHGAWYHLLANYRNNVMEFYVNGVLMGSCIQTPPGLVNGYNNIIGKDYDVNLDRFWFNGSMDDLIFFKEGLTAAEVQLLYNSGMSDAYIKDFYGLVTSSYKIYGNSAEEGLVKVYPNPTQDKLKVEITGFDPAKEYAIYVYNTTGSLIDQKSPAAATNIIDLTQQPNGIYLLQIAIGNITKERKIIKIKH